MKSALGSAPWSASVLAKAYADLAIESESIEETALWVREAFKVWPQAKEVRGVWGGVGWEGCMSRGTLVSV